MLRFATSVGFALAVANLKRRVRSLAVRGVLGAVGLVVLIIALCFFLVTAHLYLSVLINPIASAAIIGGVLLAIALLLFFLASRPMGQRSKSMENPVQQLSDTLGDSARRFSEALGPEGSPLRNPAVQLAGLALIAGFFLGRRSSRRRGDD